MHLEPAVPPYITVSGELKGVHNEVIGWYSSVGVIEKTKYLLCSQETVERKRSWWDTLANHVAPCPLLIT